MKMLYFNRMLTTLLVLNIGFVPALHAEEENANADQLAVHVTVKPLSSLTFPAEYSAPASTIAKNHATISAELNGSVQKVHVDVGDSIKQGQTLAELDCRDYEYAKQQLSSSLEAKRTQLEFAEKVFKRNKGLLKKSTIAEQSYEQAETNYLASKADLQATQIQLKTAKLNIERCHVKAPFSGQITQRQVQLGQWVAPATPLFSLLQEDNLEVSAQLASDEVQTLKNADRITFSANGVDYTVGLRSVISNINVADRTQEVRLTVAESVKLANGLPGRLHWHMTKRLLPAEYLSKRKAQYGVLYLEKDKVAFHAMPFAIEGQANPIDLPAETRILDKNRAGLHIGQSVQLKGTIQ